MRYQVCMRAKKKKKAVHKIIEDERNAQIPTCNPLKRKYPDLATSFVHKRSGMVC